MKLPLALFFLAAAAHAQTQDWPRLQGTRHGTTLVIETNVNPYGPASFTRCRLLRVDASTLTCKDLDRRTRFTFPAASIDAVYQVKEPRVTAVLGSVIVGCFIGGLVSGNPPALAIGVIGGLIWLFAAMQQSAQHQIDIWTGAAPNPLPDNEKRVLIYTR